MTILSNIVTGLALITTLAIPLVEGVCRIISLSGGGSHGAFEAGVVQQLVETPGWKPWDVYTGVSAGSLNVMAFLKDDYKSNMESLHEMWSSTQTVDVVDLFASSNSISGNNKIRNLIYSGYDRFSGVSQTGGKSFRVGVTNLYSGTFVSLELDPSQPNLNNILGSVSIPVFFPPLAISPTEIYVDGGLQKNEFFLSTLQYCNKKETEFVIDMVFANVEIEDAETKNWTLWNVASRSIDLIAHDFDNMYFKTISSCKIQKTKGTIVQINMHMPPHDITVGTLDFDHGEELWQLGYHNVTTQTFYC